MAILHHKEEKIQVVLGRLPKKYTHEQFVEMFIKLYSKDWGKIKSAYIKQSQDKEPGTVINMPKPDLYLKQILETYLTLNQPKAATAIAEPTKQETVIAKDKPVAKKKEVNIADEEPVTKPKAIAKKKTDSTEVELVKKPKAVAKKKIVDETVEPIVAIKKKAPAKKKADEEIIAPIKAKKVKITEK